MGMLFCNIYFIYFLHVRNLLSLDIFSNYSKNLKYFISVFPYFSLIFIIPSYPFTTAAPSSECMVTSAIKL